MKQHYQLLDLDCNVLLYDLIIPFLDDASWLSFGLSCRYLYEQLVKNPEIWEAKMKALDHQVEKQVKQASYLSHFNENDHSIICDNFIRGYWQFRNRMFQRLDSNNCLLDTCMDEVVAPHLHKWKKNVLQLNDNKTRMKARSMILKLQYISFRKFVFCKMNHTSYKTIHNDVATHLNHSVMASNDGFWKSYFVNYAIQQNVVECWSILLTKFSKEVDTNAWSILVGVKSNVPDSTEPLETYTRFGYCVKSNAPVLHGKTSYQVSTANKEGQLIGFKSRVRGSNIDLHVYLADGKVHRVEYSEYAGSTCRPVVSVVCGRHVVSVLPWDGNPNTLKMNDRMIM
ncbi:hypothetical protein FDP41_008020 [Naegleria fowleri]|uniref:Uncharacterized protein n=1 Tax=Naegleria fowleri TaxID=5763 RepID=A0A6A5CFR9_NAEFO|nr:uncharacterized protein FDP41_008020 [Naegleria fowleri]KAF0984105.1 hypothetical protein FDP41_008020 [Naegleria fowleri]